MKFISFLNKKDDSITILEESAKENDILIEYLGIGTEWLSNAIKIRLLKGYLSGLNSDELVVVFDAQDVAFYGNETEISEAFYQLKTDILFSAESNYYFKESKLEYYYWKYYPRSDTYFDYLNSGSFMGKKQHLLTMLDDIELAYGLNFNNDDQIINLVSDQYLFSRFYVDLSSGLINRSYKISLDHQQQIFGCSGGRMACVRWPVFSKIHNFLVFKYERRLLKTFFLKRCQDRILDFKFDRSANRFLQTSTRQNPFVVHFPATKKDYQLIYERLLGKKKFKAYEFVKPLAFLVSTIAYLESLFVLIIILILNNFKANQKQIFRYNKHDADINSIGSKELANSNERLIYLKQTPQQVSRLPEILGFLKDKKIYLLPKSNQSAEKLAYFNIIPTQIIRNLSELQISSSGGDILLLSTQPIPQQALRSLLSQHSKLTILMAGSLLDDIITVRYNSFITFPMDFPYTGSILKTKKFLFGP